MTVIKDGTKLNLFLFGQGTIEGFIEDEETHETVAVVVFRCGETNRRKRANFSIEYCKKVAVSG